jgi:hypothetical protein
MQIGRVTGLAEPTQLSQADISTVEFTLLATATQARQLLGHGSNGAERFVPMVFGTWGSSLDGIYELLDVNVDTDPNLNAAALRQVSVAARAVNRGRQIANSVLLVRGDNRNRTAAVGLQAPLYRASIPSGATAITGFNTGPGGFTVGSAVTTLGRNSIVRLTDNSQVKEAVAVATTANITLSGTVTVDGVSVSVNGTRVLVKNQTTASQNGIYVRAAGAWTRATDADGTTELDRALVFVTSGTANGGTIWQQPASNITIGTTATSWQRLPVFGLRESPRGGPVSITYAGGLGGWYDGACTITQSGDVVTGTTPLASGALIMDNGLVRIEGSEIKMATGSPLAWGEGRSLRVDLIRVGGTASFTGSLSDPTILTNSSDQTALRYRLGGGLEGAIDISMLRGSRTVTVSLNLVEAAFAHVGIESGISGDNITLLSPSPEAGTGIGYTSASNSMQYSGANDGDGNRRGLSYAGLLDSTALGGSTMSSTAKRSHVFGIHHIIGGGTTKTGDDQLYGMDRAWYAMISQQTSAGVL